MLTENNLYIIVIYVVITVNYCKSIVLLYSPLTSYLYVHWILNKYYYYYYRQHKQEYLKFIYKMIPLVDAQFPALLSINEHSYVYI